MEVSPIVITKMPEESETFTINEDEKKYLLNIKKQDDSITFIISPQTLLSNQNYIRKMNLKDIKNIHQMFFGLNSCNEFYDFIKALIDNRKLIIKTNDEKLLINFTIDYLFKQSLVEIELFPERKSNEDIINNLCKEIKELKDEIKVIKDLKDEINILKEENKNLKGENKELKNQINYIILVLFPINNSMIIKPNEFEFIKLYIKKNMNKEIKEIKKLYQATVDGGEPSVFHQKCDNIPNTLTFIESSGNRRFGGFTSIVWNSEGDYIKDDNAFLFSIDKQKIYPINKDFQHRAIYCHENQGPSFGSGHDIGIIGNPIIKVTNNSYLYTLQNTYNYNGEKDCLSEKGHILAKDYEVYQIIFE